MEILIQWKYYWKIILSPFSSFPDLFYVIEWSLSPSSHEFYQSILLEILSVVTMVGEIVHQIGEIIIVREAVLDPLAETVKVHHQIEMNEDLISALEKTVHFLVEKGELSWNLHRHILFLLRLYYNILSSKFMRVIVSIMCNSSAIVTWWLLKPSNVLVYKM